MFGISHALIVFFLIISHKGKIKAFAEDSTELVHLKQIQHPSYNAEGMASLVLPDVLKFEFKAHGHFVQLKLLKISHIPTVTPFCIYEHNESICLTEDHTDQSYEFYHDPDNNAAVSVEIDHITPHNESLYKLNGEYMVGNELFEINSADLILRRLTKKNSHHIMRRSLSSNFTCNFTFDANIPETINHTEKIQYVVELLIMIDHSIYEKFMNMSNNSITECNKKIRYHFAHMANAIDIQFSTMKAPDFNISVRLSGYVILKDVSSAPFLNNSRISTEKGYILDASFALYDLVEFLQKRQDLPSYDHAMLFTNYDTVNTELIGLGITFPSGICSHLQVSLIVNRGAFLTARTAAHQLAHNLGVIYHDGEGDAQNCSSDMAYIMGRKIIILNNITKEYAFKFSTCSVAQLRKKLNEMNSKNENCLVNIESSELSTEFLNHMQVLPGEIENVHDQCRYIYGPDSFMCPPTHPSAICYKMFCYIPSTNKQCIAINGQSAAIGTPCGNKKWCFQGNCIGNSKSSTATDDCPYPDVPALANCSLASLFQCKIKDYYKYCCDSCNKIFTDAKCKDISSIYHNQSRYTCIQFLMKHGTRQCQSQHNPNIKQYCCASCKGFTEPKCKDISSIYHNQSRYTCVQFLKTQGTRQCQSQHNPNIKQYCCASCKDLLPNCFNLIGIRINGFDCPQFISVYGTEMCKRYFIRITCCTSCAQRFF